MGNTEQQVLFQDLEFLPETDKSFFALMDEISRLMKSIFQSLLCLWEPETLTNKKLGVFEMYFSFKIQIAFLH